MQLDACRSPEDFVARLNTLSLTHHSIWGPKHYISLYPSTLKNLETFLNNNQLWFTSHAGQLARQNPAIGRALAQLALRISKEFHNFPLATALSVKVQAVANCMIFPADIIGMILDHIPTDNYRMPKTFLKYEILSKSWREHVRKAKARFINTHKLCLHDFGFPDIKACIRFAQNCGPNLKHLNLVKYNRLTDENLQSILSLCPNITDLFLDSFALGPKTLEILPTIYNLDSLRLRVSLDVTNLEKTLTNLPRLQKISIMLHPSCTKLPDLSPLTNLKSLAILEGKSLKDAQQISTLTTLESLFIQEVPRVNNIPPLWGLTDLAFLYVWNCEGITSFDSFAGCKKLRNINIWNCPLLTYLPSLDEVPALEILNLTQCSRIAELPSLYRVNKLSEIEIWNCEALKILPSINSNAPLKKLHIKYCRSLFRIPNLKKLPKLEELHLTYCLSLKSISGVLDLTHLHVLNLNGSLGIRGSVLWNVQQLKQKYPYIHVQMPYS